MNFAENHRTGSRYSSFTMAIQIYHRLVYAVIAAPAMQDLASELVKDLSIVQAGLNTVQTIVVSKFVDKDFGGCEIECLSRKLPFVKEFHGLCSQMLVTIVVPSEKSVD